MSDFPLHDELKLPHPRHPGHKGFLDLLMEMRALHIKKCQDYGIKDDPLLNLRACAAAGLEPWKGCWLRALDKVTRINVFCQKGNLENESVEDSLLDLAAYCLLALTLKRVADARKAADAKLAEPPGEGS
jgi:hypothetical protein